MIFRWRGWGWHITLAIFRAPEVPQIRLTRAGKRLEIEDRRQDVLRYVRQHQGATGPEVAEALHMHPRTALRDLVVLIDKGAIRRTGAGRWSEYFAAEAMLPV